MTVEIVVPEELKDIGSTRIAQWRSLGVKAVEDELNGGSSGLGLRSGPDAVMQMARRWIAWERDHGNAALPTQRPSNGVPQDALDRIWRDDGFRIFLSHRSEVKKEVAGLKDELEVFGAACFVAHEDIDATQDWQNEILYALASMDCLVAVVTKGFHDSNWTDQEVGYAIARGVPIIALKLDSDNPSGFIGRFQARSCNWLSAADETVKITLTYDRMFDAYVSKLRNCLSWDHGNTLGKPLPGIRKLSASQIDSLVAVYNETSELRGSFAFGGSKPQRYGPGLVYHLNRLGDRVFERVRDSDLGARIEVAKATGT